jgi:hypothetical protein
MPAVAIAIGPVGNRPPSPAEVSETLQALQPALLRVGASVADQKEAADFVLTVNFIPATSESGSQIRVVGIERTARFQEATDRGDTPEAKEWRRRVQEIERWNGGERRGQN